MKRVFHVITHLDVGGAERVAFNIAKSKNKDFEYHIVEVVRSDSEFADKLIQELSNNGVIIHRSPYCSNKKGILLFWLWFRHLYICYEPDIIHSHTEIPDLALWLFRKFSWVYFWIHPKYIRTIHNTELWTSWTGIGKLVERYYIKHKCNVAISMSTKQSYAACYGEKDIPIIYNGLEEVDQKHFYKLVPEKINVLFAGRLEWQKGIDELICVVSLLKNDGRFHFHIVGEGSLSGKIKKTVAILPNVSMYDKIYGLSQYIGSFDYLFMPSNHEGLALMPIEASFAHTPTVINRCPGLKDTLPADWPLAVSDNSVSEFIDIFKNKLFTVDYSKLSDKAYLFAKKYFSMEKMQEEYEKKYSAI